MDDLYHLYTSDYMEKVFFFCLKKTSDAYEAEDLTADISLCVLRELRRGNVPTHFLAWIWRIARNRYSRWADTKHRRCDAISGADITEFELADDSTIEEEYLRKEDLSQLRRELAFIASDYRNILIAFYIDDIKACTIAAQQNIPEGTVRNKLLRARKLLKVGMNMAREFGKMSYKPENVGFIMNGVCGQYGEPLTIIDHLLHKNLLLAAYRTPSTAAELAMELGIALPYMEDELESLVNSTLMRKSKDKYETNLFIVSAEAQEQINSNLRSITPDLTHAMTALLDYELHCHDENGSRWNEGYQPFEDAKWTLLMRLTDRISFCILDEYHKTQPNKLQVTPIGRWGCTLRPNGGEWDLLGLEDYTSDRPNFVGLHGCVDTPELVAGKEMIDFGQFKFNYHRIDQKTPEHLRYDQAEALVSVINQNSSPIPQKTLDELVGFGYLEKDDDGYCPTFLVMRKDQIIPRTEAQEIGHKRLLDKVVAIGHAHYLFSRGVICAEIPDFFKDDRYQIDQACANIFTMRGAVLEEAIANGYLHYADNDSRRMLGAYLIL